LTPRTAGRSIAPTFREATMPSEHARWWTLDPAVTFLNHGSFGATPTPVLEAQSRLRAAMEREPLRFLWRELEERLDRARGALARFVGAEAEDLAFVPNATTGVNAVLRSLRLAAGDELLVTDHEYNACRNALDAVAGAAGARVVVVQVPFPIDGPDRVVEDVLDAVTPRTRLALIDHVTSPTALVLPIERIAAGLAHRGVDTLVDGAHAPGMLPLRIPSIGAAYYTGNCHKWLCAPKGAALLWVRRDRQADVRPVVVSHGANAVRTDRSRFLIEFDWVGTDDPTPFLCVEDSIGFLEGLLPGGWPALAARNRALALAGRDLLCERLGIDPPCPDSMLGSMAAVPLPDRRPGERVRQAHIDPLQDVLWERFGIEVPVMPWPAPPRRVLRISMQAYNDLDDVRKLADALGSLLSDP
jgi:isopenicillin-N epimerase